MRSTRDQDIGRVAQAVLLGIVTAVAAVAAVGASATAVPPPQIGSERGLAQRLADGEEFALAPSELFRHGQSIFAANFTRPEGQGRPLTKGTGAPLADGAAPLEFPHNLNRIAGPDANSCGGCHNLPHVGGSGDFVTGVFVLAQRFDFPTFDSLDTLPTKGSVDEQGNPTTLQNIGNFRRTLGMSGSGLIEMLARQITEDLQTTRDALAPGATAQLFSKGISFGSLSRDASGNWLTDGAEGLPAPSLSTGGPNDPPNLIVRPFHQAGAVISLRQFTNNAMNHHHGIQTVERFGAGVDADGDGVADELSIADVSAASVFQAGLDVPGRIIPSDPEYQRAVRAGEHTFVDVGCASCHVPSLRLEKRGWLFTEPNPFNPPGNLRPDSPYVGQHGVLTLDLTDPTLPGPRPEVTQHPEGDFVEVFAFTDFKLHDITSGATDPNREALDMHAPMGSPAFFAGNSHFLTSRLWGVADRMPYHHHGLYTTLRESIDAHAGDASAAMARWHNLSEQQRLEVVEFLKSLRVLPRSAAAPIIDDRGNPLVWPAFPWGPPR